VLVVRDVPDDRLALAGVRPQVLRLAALVAIAVVGYVAFDLVRKKLLLRRRSRPEDVLPDVTA